MLPLLLLLLAVSLQRTYGWPNGTYGLPMPKSGCPEAQGFRWSTGSRTQQTEKGSHASDSMHLAGVHGSCKVDDITQHFCVKRRYHATSPTRFRWMPGQYCVYKYGVLCPPHFQSGFIYWDDAAPHFGPTIQNRSGTLPDGEYGRNTKIYFCCRSDGLTSAPIVLPSQSPFYLFKKGTSCQLVKDMYVEEEWVYWRDEDTLNMGGRGGVHPLIQRFEFPVKSTKLYYCYYRPKEPSSALHSALLAVYIIAGVVGALLVAFLCMCIAQKIYTLGRYHRRPSPYDAVNDENYVRECMLHSAAAANPTQSTNADPSHSNGAAAAAYLPVTYNGFKRAGSGGARVYIGDRKQKLPDADRDDDELPVYSEAVGGASGGGGAVVLPRPVMLGAIDQPPSYDEAVQEAGAGDAAQSGVSLARAARNLPEI